MSLGYELCGVCLHASSSHEPHNGHFMYCARCMKLCDLDEFNKDHKPSYSVVQDGYAFLLPSIGEDNASN